MNDKIKESHDALVTVLDHGISQISSELFNLNEAFHMIEFLSSQLDVEKSIQQIDNEQKAKWMAKITSAEKELEKLKKLLNSS